jgi:putative transposase
VRGAGRKARPYRDLNDSQRARLGEAAVKVGRDLLAKLGTLFSPETLLRWHRWFIARKYDGSDRRGKRGPIPKKANSIRKLVLQMAADNPSWGYGHITGELKGLGFDVHWQTVRRVMLDQGLLPDPDRPYKSTWKEFLKSHWESLAACDFFSVEAWGLKGLTRYLVFFESTWRRGGSRSPASMKTQPSRRCSRWPAT